MSGQEWRPPNRPPGGGGSVKRARERMEAGQPPMMPQPPQQAYYEPPRLRQNPPRQQIPAPGPRQRPIENRPRPQMPPGLVPRNGQAPVGVAISKPTQAPQWPLAATIEGPDPRSNPNYQPPPGRSGPPERPRRPSQTISMLDASKIQQQMPSSFQYRQPETPQYREGYDDDDVLSPGLSPIAQSSRPSTYSSVGSIPDFPVPSQPQPQLNPPRRSALGPPPTSRRGTSSYYSNASWVSPIPEESPRQAQSHGSYASSTAMPHNWDPNSPAYRYDEDEEDSYRESEEYDRYGIPKQRGGKIEERGQSQDDYNDGRGLIRSASLGKKGKASLVTTKSSDKLEAMRADPLVPKIKALQLEKVGMAIPIPGREPEWPIQGTVGSPLESGTGLLDPTPSSSEGETPNIAKAISTNDVTPSYFPPTAPPSKQKDQMLGTYNKASAIPPVLPAPSPGFSRLSAIRRPPRLDIDAVRDAEARGSLTSLPDLIRRATRLAAMMERGKRPGSRIGLNDFTSMEDLSAYNKETGSGSAGTGDKHKSGFSGMLAAFPPPGRENSPNRPLSSWPRPEAYGALDSPKPENERGEGRRRGKRRCCGLPCWGFLVLFFVLLVVIAAAVVVPIELLIIHKPSSNTVKSPAAVLQACATNSTTSCQNGGSSILITGNCACICTNGFTGSTCAAGNATGCSTSTFPGSEYTNVTLGDSISRLISGASNFSILLSGETILARFNSNNLSCVSENALVTFDGSSQLSGDGSDLVNPSSTSSSDPTTPTPTGNARRKRDDYSSTYSSTYSSYSAAPTASNSNSIIFDTSTPPSYPSSTSYGSSSPTSSPTSSSVYSSQTANPSSPFPITQETLDFARVVTLFILQEQSLDQAVSAQNELQLFLSLGTGGQMGGSIQVARNITLSTSNTVNLVDFKVDLGQGLVGGLNSSSGNSKRGSEWLA